MHRLYPPFLGGTGAVGLLVLRLVAGTAMMFHGWPKIQHATSWMPPEAPVPGVLQALAALAEFGGGLCWVLGAPHAAGLVPDPLHHGRGRGDGPHPGGSSVCGRHGRAVVRAGPGLSRDRTDAAPRRAGSACRSTGSCSGVGGTRPEAVAPATTSP